MRNVLAVFIGGALGTFSRFALDISFTRSTLVAPWLINIIGAFVLGVMVSSLWTRTSTPAWVKAGLGTGVLGGFTTFSAITMLLTQAVGMASPNTGIVTATVALGIFVLDLVLGLTAAWAGIVIGRRFGPPAVATPDAISDEGVDL